MNEYNPGEHYICEGIEHREGQIIEILEYTPNQRIPYVVISANPDIGDHTNELGYTSRFSRNSRFDEHLTLHEQIEPEIYETEVTPQTFASLFTS